MNSLFKIATLFFIIFLAIMGAYAGIVTGTGLPSANNDLPYKYFTVSFLDFCPLCGANNCLVWNIKGTYEGEWTCKYCSADYCVVEGKDKSNPVRATLIKADSFSFQMPVIMNFNYNMEV